jgi:hypothetical protein
MADKSAFEKTLLVAKKMFRVSSFLFRVDG